MNQKLISPAVVILLKIPENRFSVIWLRKGKTDLISDTPIRYNKIRVWVENVIFSIFLLLFHISYSVSSTFIKIEIYILEMVCLQKVYTLIGLLMMNFVLQLHIMSKPINVAEGFLLP